VSVGLVQVIEGRSLGGDDVILSGVQVPKILQEIPGEKSDTVKNHPDPPGIPTPDAEGFIRMGNPEVKPFFIGLHRDFVSHGLYRE
jgi:hypothetical protein